MLRRPHDQRTRGNLHRVLGHAKFDESAVDLEQAEVVAEVEIGRDGVEDQTEAARQFAKGVGGVARRPVFAGAGAGRPPSSSTTG